MKVERILKFVWDEFVYGGHLLALGAASVVFTSAILLNVPITWDFLLIVYLIFYVIYFYNRFREIENDFLTNPERTQYFKKYIKYTSLVISCSILVIAGMLFHFGNFPSLIFGLLMLLSGLFYSSFLKKFTGKIFGFKSFYVSFIWALLVIFLISYYSFPLDIAVIFIFIFIFLRCLVGTNFSDIKDIDSDKKEELLTLAIVYGERKLIKSLNLISIFSVILVVVGVYFNLLPIFSLMLILTFFYSLYYFKKLSDKKIKSPILYSVLVDGEHVPWLIFVLIGKFLLC